MTDPYEQENEELDQIIEADDDIDTKLLQIRALAAQITGDERTITRVGNVLDAFRKARAQGIEQVDVHDPSLDLFDLTTAQARRRAKTRGRHLEQQRIEREESAKNFWTGR